MKKIIALTLISLMGFSIYAMEEETITKTIPKTFAVRDYKQFLPVKMVEFFELYAKHPDGNTQEIVDAVSKISVANLDEWAALSGGRAALGRLENDGTTLLHIFVNTPHPNLEIIKYFLAVYQSMRQNDDHEILDPSKKESPYQIALERNNKEVLKLFEHYNVIPLIEQCLQGEKTLDELEQHLKAFEGSRDIGAVEKIYEELCKQDHELAYKKTNAIKEKMKSVESTCLVYSKVPKWVTQTIKEHDESETCSELLEKVAVDITRLQEEINEQKTDSETDNILSNQLKELITSIRQCQGSDIEECKKTLFSQLDKLSNVIKDCKKSSGDTDEKRLKEEVELAKERSENLKARYHEICTLYNLYGDEINENFSAICYNCMKNGASLEHFKKFLKLRKPNIDVVQYVNASEPSANDDGYDRVDAQRLPSLKKFLKFIVGKRVTIGSFLETNFHIACSTGYSDDKKIIEQMLFLANEHRDKKFSGASTKRNEYLWINPHHRFRKQSTHREGFQENVSQLILHCVNNKARHLELEAYVKEYRACENRYLRNKKSSARRGKPCNAKPPIDLDLEAIKCVKGLYGRKIDMSVQEYLNTLDDEEKPHMQWVLKILSDRYDYNSHVDLSQFNVHDEEKSYRERVLKMIPECGDIASLIQECFKNEASHDKLKAFMKKYRRNQVLIKELCEKYSIKDQLAKELRKQLGHNQEILSIEDISVNMLPNLNPTFLKCFGNPGKNKTKEIQTGYIYQSSQRQVQVNIPLIKKTLEILSDYYGCQWTTKSILQKRFPWTR